MNCPLCNVELRLSERNGVEIDYCPQCRGVWLDRGELDKIIEKSSAYQEPRYDSHERYDSHNEHNLHSKYVYDEHHGYPQGKHKKKSFLEDIFDFG